MISGDGWTLTIDTPVETVWSSGHHELAKNWRHTDGHGHTHSSLETLEWVLTGTYWCETCLDEHDEGEYRCRVCSDVVEPLWTFTGPYSFPVRGLTTAMLRTYDGQMRRTWIVRPDEYETFSRTPREEWAASVMAREPDDLQLDGIAH